MDMLTADEVALLIGYKKGASVRRMAHRGDLPPPTRHVGRTPVWARTTIETWLASRPTKRGRHGWDTTPPRQPQLIITRGLPASGKTTVARRLVESAPPGSMARVNRDDLRTMLHGGWLGQRWQESQVTIAQHAAVAALLQAGVDVICDDTNLPEKTMAKWGEIAAQCGATIQVIDLRGVAVETCVARDAERAARGERAVGAEVIEAMHAAQDRVPPVT